MNTTEVKKVLYDWVVAETGFNVIWERANAPRPTRPYIGLLVVSLNPVGTAYISPPDEFGIAQIVGQSMMILSINSYIDMNSSRIDAVNVLEELRLSLWKESTLVLFRGKDIGYLSTTSNQNVEQILGTEFEQRGILDVNFLISSSITDDVGLIERVEGIGQYLDNTGQVTHTEPFEAEV